jgi:hypothetical protein
LSFLAKVAANRNDQDLPKQRCDDLDDDQSQNEKSPRILDEVTEIILIPGFDSEKRAHSQNDVILPPEVRELLHDYVTRIASMYREHPFHNLEHASHVTMSAVKLMRRIINPDDVDFESSSSSVNKKSEETKESDRKARRKANASFYKNLHNSTFGISSDPLTQFCVVFSALIHVSEICQERSFDLSCC